MKLLILALILHLVFSTALFSQQIPIPPEYEIVTSVLGDLDHDNVDELVVVYNTLTLDEEDDESIPRELRIYKREGAQWVNWYKSDQVLYGSRDGGMMGDPLDGVEIQNGILIVRQFGGSRFKWGITDRYRFQDCGFYLIGYSHHAGSHCLYWESVDFNLSTGKIIISAESEECEDIYGYEEETIEGYKEEFYAKGYKIKMEYRRENHFVITSPNQREVRVE